MTVGEESGGATSPEEGAIVDEMAVGSARCVSRARRPAVAKAVDDPSRGGLTIDAVTTGPCEPGEAAGTSTDAEGPSRTVASGSRRVIRALMGTSTSSGTSEAKPCWRGGSSPLETSTTTGCRGKECD
jgi:hypothetical protein